MELPLKSSGPLQIRVLQSVLKDATFLYAMKCDNFKFDPI